MSTFIFLLIKKTSQVDENYINSNQLTHLNLSVGGRGLVILSARFFVVLNFIYSLYENCTNAEFFGLHFPAFGLNTLCIQSKYGKIGPGKSPYLDTFMQ